VISDLSASNFKEKERLAVAKPKTGDLHRLFIALEEFATTKPGSRMENYSKSLLTILWCLAD
jgi:hypothetical protein